MLTELPVTLFFELLKLIFTFFLQNWWPMNTWFHLTTAINPLNKSPNPVLTGRKASESIKLSEHQIAVLIGWQTFLKGFQYILDLQHAGASVLHMLCCNTGPDSRGRLQHGAVQQQMELLYEHSSLVSLDAEVGTCCHLAYGAEVSVLWCVVDRGCRRWGTDFLDHMVHLASCLGGIPRDERHLGRKWGRHEQG